jgi:RHS repeat-associated protein
MSTTCYSEYFAYSPGGKRVWNLGERAGGAGQQTVQEVWFWSPQGQRLAFYSLTHAGATVFTFQESNVYLGGKLVGQYNSAGAHILKTSDRLGSFCKYYPYGEERNPTGASGEKFATYFHDNVVGLNYADQCWHANSGRFLTPDPYQASGGPADPGSWNRYAYVGGDPVNAVDPAGLCGVVIGGIGQTPGNNSGSISDFTNQIVGVAAFPYSPGSAVLGVLEVADQMSGPNLPTAVALTAIRHALGTNTGPIDIIAFSGGATALTLTWEQLTSDERSRIRNISYLAPGSVGGLPPGGYGSSNVYVGSNVVDNSLAVVNEFPDGATVHRQNPCGHDAECLLNYYSSELRSSIGGACSSPGSFFRTGDPISVSAPFLEPPFYVNDESYFHRGGLWFWLSMLMRDPIAATYSTIRWH